MWLDCVVLRGGRVSSIFCGSLLLVLCDGTSLLKCNICACIRRLVQQYATSSMVVSCCSDVVDGGVEGEVEVR
jgi:hypothetical protein